MFQKASEESVLILHIRYNQALVLAERDAQKKPREGVTERACERTRKLCNLSLNYQQINKQKYLYFKVFLPRPFILKSRFA